MERVWGTALRKGAGAPTGGGLGVRVPHVPARMGWKRCPASVQHIHSLTGQRFQKEKGWERIWEWVTVTLYRECAGTVLFLILSFYALLNYGRTHNCRWPCLIHPAAQFGLLLWAIDRFAGSLGFTTPHHTIYSSLCLSAIRFAVSVYLYSLLPVLSDKNILQLMVDALHTARHFEYEGLWHRHVDHWKHLGLDRMQSKGLNNFKSSLNSKSKTHTCHSVYSEQYNVYLLTSAFTVKGIYNLTTNTKEELGMPRHVPLSLLLSQHQK